MRSRDQLSSPARPDGKRGHKPHNRSLRSSNASVLGPEIRPAAEPDPVYAALTDPTRRAILDLLRGGERAVADIRARFHTSQPAISQHLAVLRRAGLVRSRKDGRRRLYRLHGAPLESVAEWIEQFEAFWSQRLDNLGEYLRARRQSAPTHPGDNAPTDGPSPPPHPTSLPPSEAP